MNVFVSLKTERQQILKRSQNYNIIIEVPGMLIANLKLINTQKINYTVYVKCALHLFFEQLLYSKSCADKSKSYISLYTYLIWLEQSVISSNTYS